MSKGKGISYRNAFYRITYIYILQFFLEWKSKRGIYNLQNLGISALENNL